MCRPSKPRAANIDVIEHFVVFNTGTTFEFLSGIILLFCFKDEISEGFSPTQIKKVHSDIFNLRRTTKRLSIWVTELKVNVGNVP